MALPGIARSSGIPLYLNFKAGLSFAASLQTVESWIWKCETLIGMTDDLQSYFPFYCSRASQTLMHIGIT
jgi:hypothetical protein